jgi:hypothetical protein
MYKDGKGNSLNHKMEELEEIKKMAVQIHRQNDRETERDIQAGR